MYSEKTFIVDIVTNGSGDDVWYSLSAPGKDIISALRTGDVLLRKITRTERNNAATPAVPQSDEYDYFKLVAVRDVEDGAEVAMLFDNGDMYVYNPNEDEYPYLDGIEPGKISLVPSASAEDAGKVLTVNEHGAPSWATGGVVLVVTETQHIDGEYIHRVLDKTYKEIKDSALPVMKKMPANTDATWTVCTNAYKQSNTYKVKFGATTYETDSENGYPTNSSEI